MEREIKVSRERERQAEAELRARVHLPGVHPNEVLDAEGRFDANPRDVVDGGSRGTVRGAEFLLVRVLLGARRLRKGGEGENEEGEPEERGGVHAAKMRPG